jgi:glycerophosphoryl diester phosphodiesterase
MHASYYGKTLNFGHRGASAHAPENTLAAFILAAEQGAAGIEFDVQLSSDGVPVICHDFSVDKTTDHQGKVSDFTLSELKQMDAGSWFGPAFAGERIPTLDELVDAVGDRLLLNLELKTAALRANGLEEAVAAVIRRRSLYDRIIVSSFNPAALVRLRQLDEQIDLGLLYSPDMPLYLRRAWARHLIPCQVMHPYYEMVDERYVRWAKTRGYRVNVWTVDDPAEMRRLIALGVDVVITNTPAVLRDVLAERG